MSFDKEYPNRKDWRKPYRGSKRFDRTCRCHGGCKYCEGNRTYTAKRDLEAAGQQLNAPQEPEDNEDPSSLQGP